MLKIQHTTPHCIILQHTATHCSTLQHTATHCNTLQHTLRETHRSCIAGRLQMPAPWGGLDEDEQLQRQHCCALHCVALCCSVLRLQRQHCYMLQCAAVCCSCNVSIAVCYSVFSGCSVLQCAAAATLLLLVCTINIQHSQCFLKHPT